MNKTAEYVNFEEGFLKEAAENGCDIPFLRGLLKEADELVDTWKAAFDELAEKSGDPLYRTKIANEIIYFYQRYPEMLKKADLGSTMNDMLGSAGNQIGLSGLSGWLTKNPQFLMHLLKGAGGGGLTGLLGGMITGHPMAGMMLGGLGGAGLGAAYDQGYLSNLFNDAGAGASGAKPAAPLTSVPQDNKPLWNQLAESNTGQSKPFEPQASPTPPQGPSPSTSPGRTELLNQPPPPPKPSPYAGYDLKGFTEGGGHSDYIYNTPNSGFQHLPSPVNNQLQSKFHMAGLPQNLPPIKTMPPKPPVTKISGLLLSDLLKEGNALGFGAQSGSSNPTSFSQAAPAPQPMGTAGPQPMLAPQPAMGGMQLPGAMGGPNVIASLLQQTPMKREL